MTYRQFCESHAVEGILISDLITEDQRLQELMEIPVPFVAMHSECLAPEQRIGMDNAAAAADMTRYLLKNVVAAGSEGSMEQADRMIGVLSAMGQENLSLQEEDILDWGQGEAGEDATITGEEQQAYRKMKEYLSHYGTGHHTAVLCFSDYLAFGIPDSGGFFPDRIRRQQHRRIYGTGTDHGRVGSPGLWVCSSKTAP